MKLSVGFKYEAHNAKILKTYITCNACRLCNSDEKNEKGKITVIIDISYVWSVSSLYLNLFKSL